MEEKQIAFENATRMILWGIANQVPFDVLANTEEVQEAIELGYDISIIKRAWL